MTLEDRMVYESDDDFVICRKDKGQTIKEYYQVKHNADATKNMNDGDVESMTPEMVIAKQNS